MERNLTSIIEQSFTQYAGAVLQSRALVDVRDCLKPSARQIFYSMWRNKYIHSKPYEKTNAPMGDAMKEFYIHGNASCVGIMMRAAQNFAMRVPICEVEGNCGTLISSGNWASERYTSTRLAEIANYLFADIEKETIDEWRDNYADNLQYPAVLPSKGYYNLVNGSAGIAIGMSASLPSFNLREMNEMLIRLLNNPDLPAEEAVILPDFPTGAILLNKGEVIESLINGRGKACKLRSVVTFDSKERCFIVSEIPYGTYTNTICGQLSEILESEDNPGVERFNDLTGKTPLIKIYLTKNANPDKVLKFLYKNTSLQSHYAINMTMLDKGKYPKVFSLKEAMMEFLKHQEEVYIRSFSYDLRKIKARLHILEGLIKAISMIDEVVKTIKMCADAKNASIGLQRLLLIDDAQAKAILDLKLSRLTHLDIAKLENEQASLEKEKSRIEAILSDGNLLKKEIEKGLREVANKFGDARRTQILDIQNEESDEPTEIRLLQVSLTNKNRIYAMESSTLYVQKKGGVGKKLKLDKGEYVMATCSVKTDEEILFFTQSGNSYHYPAAELPLEELIYTSLLFIHDEEHFCNLCGLRKDAARPYILFVTKNGLLKKSLVSEYNIKRSGAVRAIALDEGDEIVSVLFLNEEQIGILSAKGNFLWVETADIRPIGRVTRGIKGMKLNTGDYVVGARVMPEKTATVLSISASGNAKQTDITEFSVQGKNTKGARLQKLLDGDKMADFKPVVDEKEISIVSTHASLKIQVDEVPTLSRGAQGSRAIKLGVTDHAVVIL